MFPAGASTEFVFPIGCKISLPGILYYFVKHKPGSITLRPINERHAAINDPAENELVYYWSVSSDGFEGLAVTHKYQYLEDDVKGNESMYVGGRYDYEAYTWTNLGNVINTSDNTISFTADYITESTPQGIQKTSSLSPYCIVVRMVTGTAELHGHLDLEEALQIQHPTGIQLSLLLAIL